MDAAEFIQKLPAWIRRISEKNRQHIRADYRVSSLRDGEVTGHRDSDLEDDEFEQFQRQLHCGHVGSHEVERWYFDLRKDFYEVEAERDKYKAALEKIGAANGNDKTSEFAYCVGVALEALKLNS
jgi:hypothetical protein